MKLKSGKEEIVYLLAAVIKKYEQTTGQELIRNTNRKNYEGLAIHLSKISNQLPYTSAEKKHDEYPPDRNPGKLSYPYFKYDITGGQIKDASNGIVSNPRNFLIDACYIYLFGVGRLGFSQDPQDSNLIADFQEPENNPVPEPEVLRFKFKLNLPAIVLGSLLVFALAGWYFSYHNWNTVKKDMNVLPYQPTKAEIDSLEGVWLVYIGSPQARLSDENRYHMVVNNLVDVKYKDGYFTFNRYGASFDHFGYMQFERKNLVSIHSYIRHEGKELESPRLSLMRLDQPNNKINVISASWNFDVGKKNNVIGIREVYIKQGKGGTTEEIINTIENSSCHCKIVKWKNEKETKTYYLKNTLIESLEDKSLTPLLDENSIILSNPNDLILLKKGSLPVK